MAHKKKQLQGFIFYSLILTISFEHIYRFCMFNLNFLDTGRYEYEIGNFLYKGSLY